MNKRTSLFVASIVGIGGLAIAAAGQAAADTFPSKPIHYVLHAGAGGGTDTMARTIAPEVEKILGQKVVVENRKGGGGAIQMTYVTKAKPDGYIIGSTTGSLIGRMNTVLKSRFKIDDFEWTSGLLTDAFVFGVPAGSKAKTLKDMIKTIKSKPGTIKIAGFAVGGAQWVGWNIFSEGVGINANDAIWVPYDNMGQAATATVGKHADLTVNFVGQTLDHKRAGNIRLLAIMSDKRAATISDVPTVHEAGFPKVDVDYVQFRGIVMPKGTPAAIQDKINDAFQKALKSKSVVKWMKNSSLEPMGYGPARFRKFADKYDKTTARWVSGLQSTKKK
ncbi:MAG: tripartite tricarboxylate transporter substrate binding protein [Rhodospirillales bacterium]